MLCQNFLSLCPIPPVSPLNLTGWFAKPKPYPLPKPKKPSGKRLKVLHLSDIHLDPRTYRPANHNTRTVLIIYVCVCALGAGYGNGAEANCSAGACCRTNVHNNASPNMTLLPAPRFGSFLWYAAILFLSHLSISRP